MVDKLFFFIRKFVLFYTILYNILKLERTKLLRVWHSWGEERKNVRFFLRRAEKTWTFSRSSSKRRKLRRVDGPEVFIDGPCGTIKEDQRSLSDDSISESGSTTSGQSFTSDSTTSEIEETNEGTSKFSKIILIDL